MDSVEGLDVRDFTDAFETHYEADAHFICYQPAPYFEPWTRINKKGVVLAELREQSYDLVASVFALDIDNHGHRPWSECGRTWEDFLDSLVILAGGGFLPAASWSVAYATRGGARLVYVLDRPVPVDQAEPLHRGLVASWAAAGVVVDTGCSDWTREFRLPNVTRAADDRGPEHATWETDYARPVEFQLENRLEVDSIVPLGAPADVRTRLGEDLDFEKPTPEDAKKLLETYGASGRIVETAWSKEARRRLRGRECFAYCFENRVLREGDRENGVQRLAGQVVSLLYPNEAKGEGLEGTTPAHVYALLVGSVEQLEPDAEHADWTETLYSAVCRYWSGTEAEAGERAEQEQLAATVAELDASALVLQVLRGMRSWCREPALHSQDEQAALVWLREHLIVCVNGDHFIMSRSGYYDALGVALAYVPARIRELGMEMLIPIEQPNPNGNGFMPTPPGQLVTRYGTNVGGVRGAVEQPGATVENVGTDKATLVLPMFSRRRDLEPTFDEDVDEWLRQFAGSPQAYEKLCKWLGFALAFDQGPICALSIAGPPGVGKKLLVHGLKETLDTNVLAFGSDLTATHGTGLLHSPFLSINEGFPTTKGSADPADAFRRLVSGEIEPINPKFKTPIHVKNPVRVILAANNLEVVQVLSGGRNLSPDDRAALADRLWHLNVPASCAEWIAARGGMEFTGVAGRRWIEGDGNEPSDFVVAKHFLWLWENRGARIGKRFLVDGDRESDVMQELRLGGAALPVVECLIDMLNAMDGGKASYKGLTIEDGKVFVLASAIKEFAEKKGLSKFDGFGSKQLTSVLKGLRVADHGPRTLESRKEFGKQRWNEVDIRSLALVAEKDLQKPCRLLRRLLEGAPITPLRQPQAQGGLQCETTNETRELA